MATGRFREYSPRDLIIEHTRIRVSPLPRPSTSHDDDQFQVIFDFTGKHCYRQWIIRPDSTALEPWVRSWTVLPRKRIQFNSPASVTATHKERMYRALIRGLVGLRLSLPDRENLADRAVEEAWDTLVTSSMANKQLRLHIRFSLIHRQVSNRNRNHRVDVRDLERDPAYTDRGMFDEMILADSGSGQYPSYNYMAPASQSSIESLKRAILVDGNRGSCSICLEDFDEGVCIMPCSHMFHGDCITRWLSTSHHCPVCRFQMPTS